MLDTNTVRQAVSGRSPRAVARIAELPAGILCVSVITYGESMFGEKRRPEAVAIARANARFYAEAEILPFTQEAADTYGALRADMERVGLPLGSLDMLIAAHAVSVDAVLVTADRAFRHVPNLETEDWTSPRAV
jgi:tRNA(fMet)-specific endonuclease VapC